jgi:hypothetical protein
MLVRPPHAQTSLDLDESERIDLLSTFTAALVIGAPADVWVAQACPMPTP